MDASGESPPAAPQDSPIPAWARRAGVRPSGWQQGAAARPRVAIVGPCAAGKTTLVAALQQRGHDAHAVAQEHSGVPYLWQLSEPDLLIFLDVALAATAQRRENAWPHDLYAAQQARLANARQHADLYLDTSPLSADEVAARADNFLAACLAPPIAGRD